MLRRWFCLLALLWLAGVIGFSFETDIRADEIAIMQFDSRKPSAYWEVSATWNNLYCHHHGHKYLYYTSSEQCRHGNELLADPWCKVLAMIQSTKDHPRIKAFIYMDSDAVLDKYYFNTSLNTVLETTRLKLNWDIERKPIVFNQDGPCWWCNLVSKVGYTMCLNAGTVVWLRHPTSDEILRKWWDSTMDSYETNPLKRKFRTSWPWEQDRQMAIYNSSSDKIQVTSQPENPYMLRMKGGSHLIAGGWCLSHLPRSGCFISHFCANQGSKSIMERRYQELADLPLYRGSRAPPAASTTAKESDKFKIYHLRFAEL